MTLNTDTIELLQLTMKQLRKSSAALKDGASVLSAKLMVSHAEIDQIVTSEMKHPVNRQNDPKVIFAALVYQVKQYGFEGVHAYNTSPVTIQVIGDKGPAFVGVVKKLAEVESVLKTIALKLNRPDPLSVENS